MNINGLDENGKPNGWRIGREIPLVLLLAIVIQTGGFIWWMASLNSTVANQGSSLSKVESRIVAIETQISAFSNTMTTPIALNAQKTLVLESELRELRLRVDTIRYEQVRNEQQIEGLLSRKLK